MDFDWLFYLVLWTAPLWIVALFYLAARYV
jgi:hypothetical protein